MFFDRHQAFYIQSKNNISVWVFFPVIWDTFYHYPLQYNPSTVNSALLPWLLLLSVNYPVHMPCFFPSLTVVSYISVSFTDGIWIISLHWVCGLKLFPFIVRSGSGTESRNWNIMFEGLGLGLGSGLGLGLVLGLELIILGTLSLYYYAHSITPC